MTILTHAYSGWAYPAEAGPSYYGRNEPELIAGAFRVVEDEIGRAALVVGNGEDPEKFWRVDREEWTAAAEEHTSPSPPFVESIGNPIIRAGLRRQVADMRALARRCSEDKAPTNEVNE